MIDGLVKVLSSSSLEQNVSVERILRAGRWDPVLCEGAFRCDKLSGAIIERL